eukprot:TRINITY_DN7934_c0_g1_i2.p1 TRINITY_DN7934_c0_g1~~TRINITY_DN7934_c0_g1_i2.p1  ORF type:complete len:300 (-),score=96.26 TRINITY_DN7934_c0_g1_i2:183-1082(-)
MSYMKGDLLSTVRVLVQGGVKRVPKWFKAMEKVPPQPKVTRCKRVKKIVFPEDPLIESFYARHPEAKLDPVDLRSFDPPLARFFAQRQLELMQQGIPKMVARDMVEEEVEAADKQLREEERKEVELLENEWEMQMQQQELEMQHQNLVVQQQEIELRQVELGTKQQVELPQPDNEQGSLEAAGAVEGDYNVGAEGGNYDEEDDGEADGPAMITLDYPMDIDEDDVGVDDDSNVEFPRTLDDLTPVLEWQIEEWQHLMHGLEALNDQNELPEEIKKMVAQSQQGGQNDKELRPQANSLKQ